MHSSLLLPLLLGAMGVLPMIPKLKMPGQGHDGAMNGDPNLKSITFNGDTFQPGPEGIAKLAKLKTKLLQSHGTVNIDGQTLPVDHAIVQKALLKTEMQLKYPNLSGTELDNIIKKNTNGSDPATTKIKADNASNGAAHNNKPMAAKTTTKVNSKVPKGGGGRAKAMAGNGSR